jgi:hypothetical protein
MQLRMTLSTVMWNVLSCSCGSIQIREPIHLNALSDPSKYLCFKTKTKATCSVPWWVGGRLSHDGCQPTAKKLGFFERATVVLYYTICQCYTSPSPALRLIRNTAVAQENRPAVCCYICFVVQSQDHHL